jgi:D-amino peptidase
MTGEVNAAVRGIHAASRSTEVVVADSHGSYRNLLVEQLHPQARLLRGRPRKLAMVHDADRADAVMFIGYHARAGRHGLLAHTFHDVVRDIRCNGRSYGEAGLNAALGDAVEAVDLRPAGSSFGC